MKATFLFGALLAIATVTSTTSCEDGFKSYARDNTARPTIPDERGRNLGDDEVKHHAGERQEYDNEGDRTIYPGAHAVPANPDSTNMKVDHTATGHNQH